jgi:hypothetical protein
VKDVTHDVGLHAVDVRQQPRKAHVCKQKEGGVVGEAEAQRGAEVAVEDLLRECGNECSVNNNNNNNNNNKHAYAGTSDCFTHLRALLVLQAPRHYCLFEAANT